MLDVLELNFLPSMRMPSRWQRRRRRRRSPHRQRQTSQVGCMCLVVCLCLQLCILLCGATGYTIMDQLADLASRD